MRELVDKITLFMIIIMPIYLYARIMHINDKYHIEDLENAASVGKPITCEGCGEDLTRVGSVRISGGPWLCMRCFYMKETRNEKR